MSKLGMYLVRNTDYCAETRNLIEDVVRSITEQNDFLSTDAKKAILRDALQGMGFSDEQLTAFAKCEIPTEYKTVPVEVGIRRLYRLYIRVPMNAGTEEVVKETDRKILNDGVEDCDLEPDFDIEEEDILGHDIDWEGAENE